MISNGPIAGELFFIMLVDVEKKLIKMINFFFVFFQEGDTQKNFRIQKRLDRNFQLAMEEASAALKHRKEVIAAHALSKKDKPDSFVSIRSNKFVSIL